jgi:MFS family permease
MTSILDGRQKPVSIPGSFSTRHPWDHKFFLSNVVLASTVTVIGFGIEIVHRFRTHAPSYPLIVHLHAVAFTAWLVLLVTQTHLIGSRRFDMHRRLGVAGAALAISMVVLGVSISFVVGHIEHAAPHPQPCFLFVRLADMASFAVLAMAAIAARKAPAAHKRLILLATLQIADAGFGGTLGPLIAP